MVDLVEVVAQLDAFADQAVLLLDLAIAEAKLEQLVETVNGTTAAKCAVLAEGEAADREDIIFLEYLPLFNADGTPQ